MMFKVWVICTFIAYAEFWIFRITLLKYSLGIENLIWQFERNPLDVILGELIAFVIVAVPALIAIYLTYAFKRFFMEGADGKIKWLVFIVSLISFVELYGVSWFLKTMIIDA
jgi:hypothetical protein